jgi:uroporphyrinogen decarboxylase
MGLPFALKKDAGPTPDRPIRTIDDLARLNPELSLDSFLHIRALLSRVKEELRGELPVIVFAGAPFTVATYCIGTGKDMAGTRRFAAEQPVVWGGLLDRLSHATGQFLKCLIADGAHVYQLFDSWAGMLTIDEYNSWAQPFHQAIFQAAGGVPRILFVKECPHLDSMTASGCEVVSLGKRHDLAAARERYPHLTFQGNVDESILRSGTPEQVTEAVRSCIRAGGGRRHIVNLNHGVGKETPVANFEAYVRAARASV